MRCAPYFDLPIVTKWTIEDGTLVGSVEERRVYIQGMPSLENTPSFMFQKFIDFIIQENTPIEDGETPPLEVEDDVDG